jgi:hypothetical protein
MSDNRLIASPFYTFSVNRTIVMLDGRRAAVTGQMEESVLAVAGKSGGKDRSG